MSPKGEDGATQPSVSPPAGRGMLASACAEGETWGENTPMPSRESQPPLKVSEAGGFHVYSEKMYFLYGQVKTKTKQNRANNKTQWERKRKAVGMSEKVAFILRTRKHVGSGPCHFSRLTQVCWKSFLCLYSTWHQRAFLEIKIMNVKS